jgi:hypothetical protein
MTTPTPVGTGPPRNDSAPGCDPGGGFKSYDPNDASISQRSSGVNRLKLRPYQQEAVRAINQTKKPRRALRKTKEAQWR